MDLLDAFLDLIFPPRCLGCTGLGRDLLCGKCRQSIRYIDICCPICGKPSFNSPKPQICSECHYKTPAFNAARSMALYEGPVKEAIHKFKFRGKKDLAPVFAELLQGYARASSFMSLVLGVDLAVPVPLFAARQKERGFNQSELIAELFCDRLNIPFSKDVIRRGRQTKPQFDLKRADRFLNVSSAFTPTHGHDIAGKTVLLIDDILTTGATASECAKTLKSNGASRVFVLTLSRALED